jgi:hypothetical protein
MSHDKHTIDNCNKDIEVLRLQGISTRAEAREYYLDLRKT